jgi:hypothetical protein
MRFYPSGSALLDEGFEKQVFWDAFDVCVANQIVQIEHVLAPIPITGDLLKESSKFLRKKIV